MKTCLDCGEDKPLSEFYVHKAMDDGHLNKCKVCVCARVRKHRRENDSVREYDCKRAKLPHRKAHRKRVVKKHIAEHPEACRARRSVSYAIRTGRLERQPCEVCGVENVHGHHEDYSKPLDVIWLCPLHHHRLHAERARA